MDDGSEKETDSGHEQAERLARDAMTRAFERLVIETIKRLGFDVRTNVETRRDGRLLKPDAVVSTSIGPVVIEIKAPATSASVRRAADQVDVFEHAMTGLAGALIVVPDGTSPSDDPRVVPLAHVGQALQRIGEPQHEGALEELEGFRPTSVDLEIHLPFVSMTTRVNIDPALATLIINGVLLATVAVAGVVLLAVVGLLDQLRTPLEVAALIAIIGGAISALIVRVLPTSRLTDRILRVVRSVGRNTLVYFVLPTAAIVVGGLILNRLTTGK